MTPRTGSIYLGLLLAAACGDDPIGASDGATETADGSGTGTTSDSTSSGPTATNATNATGGSGTATGDDTGNAGVDDSGTATGPTGEDTMQGTGGGGSSESGPPPECEPDPEPTPGGRCSPDCTNGCAGDVCEIECIGDAACETQTLSCAPEMPCVITCDGPDACDEAIIACSLQCTGDPEACLELEMTCGAGECTATCDPESTPPTVTCGSSCACAGC
jgi:hypothetical protein